MIRTILFVPVLACASLLNAGAADYPPMNSDSPPPFIPLASGQPVLADPPKSLAATGVIIADGDSIAFLGDSLTALGVEHKPNGYVNLVMEGLKQAGVNATAIPAGIGGNTSRDMLVRLESDVIAKKPVWMTLNSGINDTFPLSVEEFGETLAKIVERAEAAGIKVILLNTTIGAGEDLGAADTIKRAQFCGEFKKLAEAKNLPLVDLNAAMTHELQKRQAAGYKGLQLTYDGTHLNGVGNQIVAEEVLRTMGVPDSDLTAAVARWQSYPSAVGMPTVSINDFLRLKMDAKKRGLSVETLAAEILTSCAK